MAQRPAQPAPNQKTTAPEELIRRAAQQSGLPAAELLFEAAQGYKSKGDVVSVVHALDRALNEIEELIESPPAAKLGAALEFELGRTCEEDLGRFEEALLHYQRAFKLRPDYLEPLRRGRLIYQSLGDMDMVARLSELHLANLNAADAKSGVALALELGQLKLRLSDPTGAIEVLRQALRLHNEAGDESEVPELLMATLAEAYVSPDYLPGASEKDQARRRASDIYLSLARRHLDPLLVQVLDRAQRIDSEGEEEDEGEQDGQKGKAAKPTLESLIAEAREGNEFTEGDKRAVMYLKKAMEADVRNVTAASLLETMYLRSPEPLRTTELIKLYRSGARVTRRGPKLLKLMEQAGTVDPAAVIDACRAGIDAVSSVDEWRETRQTLQEMLQKSGDLLGLAALKEEDAVESALPEERAELIMQAAEFYQRGGDQERYIACLKQAFHELPLHTEAFRKLSDYYKSRRDFIGLAVIQENRMAAQFETARLDLASYSKQLEELAELYEKKLQDVVSAAAIWRRIDELLPSVRSQSERKRLGQRLTRIDMQVSELQIELERTAAGDAARVELLRRLAQLYRELHEPKHAAAVYEELLHQAPTDLQSIKILIELREQSGDLRGQLELLRQQVGIAVDRAERLALLRRMMSLCDQQMIHRDERWDGQGGIEMTIWVCRSLLAELPSDRDALRRLSDALQLLGNKPELLDVLESYLKVAPTPREKLALHKQIAKVAEDTDDMARSVSHLERAVRICPPGPESEQVLSELARVYGRQGRTELAVQTLELCLRQNPRASVELFRILGRITQSAENEAAVLEKSVRAFREVLTRAPEDQEALTALLRLHRVRSEWVELEQVLRRLLRVEPPLPPRERLQLALELAEVLGQHMSQPKQAAQLLEQVQAESPVVDLRVHRHLRGLYEEMGDYPSAARSAERELLLTEDPVARLERALEIAQLWRVRAKDNARALVGYERVVRIAPDLMAGTPEGDAVRRLVVHALEAMSQMFAANSEWREVVLIGQKRLNIAVEQAEPMQAAAILIEMAQVYEEKLQEPGEGFTLRKQAFEIAPDLLSLEQLSAVAEKYGQWQPLCDLHVARVREAQEHGDELAIESLLAAANIYEQRLHEPLAAFKLLRKSLPMSVSAAIAVTTPGESLQRMMVEMNRLVRIIGKRDEDASDDKALSLDSAAVVRELIATYRSLVDELVRLKSAGSEDTAVRMHRLLGEAARLRDEVLGDTTGALGERMHAFTVGGERDHSEDPAASLVFQETVDEIHRLALVSGQIKEAITVDTRRQDRADSEVRKQRVACESAAWLDDHGGDPQRALRACVKALTLCTEGSDAQSEMRGRLFRIGQKMGLLAWDEIARAERNLVASSPAALRKRLLYLASMWQLGAADLVRAIDTAGQAYRLTYFPAGLPSASKDKGGPSLAELVVQNPDEALLSEQREIRALLHQLAQASGSEGDGPAKLVALLDNLTTQLTEAGAPLLAAQVALDAGEIDERRGRLGHAERRYQDALKQPGTVDLALQRLERIYRQQKRLSDLAVLLEKRRPLVPESAQRQVLLDLAAVYQEINKYGPAVQALNQAIAIDDSDPAPYLLMAKLYEGQRTFLRAVEAYRNAATRTASGVEGAQALLAAAELLERKLDDASEAAELTVTALRRALVAQQQAVTAGSEVSAALIAVRDAAWTSVERLLNTSAQLPELAALLNEQLAATPATATAEQAGLLDRRLAVLTKIKSASSSATPQPGVDPQVQSRAIQGQLLQTLEQLLRVRPDDDALMQTQQALLTEQGNLAAAREVAQQRVQLATRQGADARTQAERWSSVGKYELELQNFAGAEAALEQALALCPDNMATLQGLVALHQQTNNPAGQVAALTRVAALEPELDQAVATMRQAASVMQESLGDMEGARKLLLSALERTELAAGSSSEPADFEVTQRALAEVLLPLFDLAQKDGDSVAALSYGRRALETGAVPTARATAVHNVLGQAALAAGDTFDAMTHFESSLRALPGQLAPTLALVELLSPAGEHMRVDTVVTEALQAADKGEYAISGAERTRLLLWLADAKLALGQSRAAYDALLAASELATLELPQQLKLGELAFTLGEYTEAARWLGALLPYTEAVESLPAPLTVQRLADVLDQAATAELRLEHGAVARQLWEAALMVLPGHQASADHILDVLLQSPDLSDVASVMPLLQGRAERAVQAGNLATAVTEYQRAADLAATRLEDPRKAQELLGIALAQFPVPPPAELLPLWTGVGARLFDSALQLQDYEQAQTLAQQLAAVAPEVSERVQWWRRAAQAAVQGGQGDAAKQLLKQALAEVPADLQLLLDLVPQLSDAEAAADLAALLQAAAVDGNRAHPESRQQLVQLWRQLAQAHTRLGTSSAAADAYEQALALVTAHADESETQTALHREVLDVLTDEDGARTRTHVTALLQSAPLDRDLLSRLQRVEELSGHRGASWRLQQLLHLLDPNLSAPGPVTPIPNGAKLEEADHSKLADPSARALGEVMATLWDGVYGVKAPTLDTLGAASTDRLQASESSADELARLFAVSSRVLGNQRAGLYRPAAAQHLHPKVFARLPTALVTSQQLTKLGLPAAQFIVARAIEGLRPEYILATVMSQPELDKLLSLAVRAFHPRYSAKPGDDVSAWKRELAYRAVKRLTELFKEQGDTEFSTSTWRVAVRRTLQRAALLVTGDLLAAAHVIRTIDLPLSREAKGDGYFLRLGEPDSDLAAEAEADIADLAAFFIDPASAPLLDRLHPR
ncbi:MAG TPA: hypothetical protein PLA87_04290 [Pseudomonadota bacterium]|nr:hypothetical protein [Pseudomonadota bacterium]